MEQRSAKTAPAELLIFSQSKSAVRFVDRVNVVNVGIEILTFYIYGIIIAVRMYMLYGIIF